MDSCDIGWRPLAESWGHGTEFLCYTKCGEFLDSQVTISFSMTALHGVSYM
jgi:hypothetical protein